MKLQLSLEMQLYLALAGISLLSALVFFAKFTPQLVDAVSGYKVLLLISQLENRISSGGTSFSLYLPQGVCGSTSSEGLLITKYGTFSIPYNLDIPNSTFCPDNRYVNLKVSYNSTSFRSELVR